MSRLTIIVLVVVTAFTITANPASAQDSVAQLNADGMAAFARGDYEVAAEIFGRAYALDPRPELLKNSAVAWYKANRCDEAVSSATTYLRAAKDTAEAKQMRALVGACRVRLAQEAVKAGSLDLAEQLLDKAEAGEPDDTLVARIDVLRVEIAKRRASDTEPDPAQVEITPLDEVDAAPEAIAVEQAADPSEPPEPGTPVAAPILVASGSTVLAGALVYHLIMALSVEPSFRRVAAAGTDQERYDRLDRSLRRANVLVPVVYAVGAATLATGVIVWIAASPSGDVAVTLRGTF